MNKSPEDLLPSMLFPSLERIMSKLSLNEQAVVRELYRRSMRDELTGLFSRDAYENSHGIIQADARKGKPIIYPTKTDKKKPYNVGILMVDLDDFKQINDTFGHLAGDRALRDFANILMGQTATTDYKFRFGGDEFLVLLLDADKKTGSKVVPRIDDAVGTYNSYNTQEKNDAKGNVVRYQLAFSAGYALWHCDDRRSFELVLRDADARMYAQKNRKKVSRA